MARSQYGLPTKAATDDPRGLEPYIRETAKKHGVDPDVAVRVAKSEGLRGFRSGVQLKGGGEEPSYGAFQLYTGGGLGNEFQKETGLDPRDPKNEKATIDYALKKASQVGWGPWHGAKNTGIGEWEGISGSGAATAASDTSIPETKISPSPASTDTAQTGFPSPLGGVSDQSGIPKQTVKEGLGDVFAGIGKAMSGAGAGAAATPAQPVAVAPAAPAPRVVPMVDPKVAESQRQQLALAMQRLNSGRLV